MTSFQVNCTLPSTEVNYVSGANVRGTLDILWSSISIIILCTWSVQHLNIPLQSRPQTTRQKIGRKIFLLERKVRWMLINVLAPEVTVAKASADLASARSITRELAEWAEKDGVDWSLAHSFFANMGGFAVRFGDGTPEKVDDDEDEAKEEGDQEDGDEGTEEGQGEDEENEGDGGDSEEENDNADINARQSLLGHQPRLDEENQLQQSSTNSSTDSSPTSQAQVSVQDPVSNEETNSQSSGQQNPKIKNLRSGLPVDVTSMPASFQVLAFSRIRWQGVDAIEWFLGVLQPRVGKVDWHIDPENQKAVIKAMEGVTYSNFITHKQYWLYNVIPLQGNVWVPSANQLLYARKNGIIDSLPSLPSEDLDDLSKTNSMLKLITLGQILWLILQLIVRKTENLPSTQLEIAVLAFSVLSLASYLILWSKPQDIQTCFYTTAARRPLAQDVEDLGHLGPVNAGPFRSQPWIPSNYVNWDAAGNFMFVAGGFSGLSLFGALHCLAWDSHFPTSVERLLWRISSIYTASAGTIVALVGIGILGLDKAIKFKSSKTNSFWSTQTVMFSISSVLILGGYLICRLYLTVEIFRSLFFSPPEAFISTDWPSYLPHLM
jgi:hypothetical protein